MTYILVIIFISGIIWLAYADLKRIPLKGDISNNNVVMVDFENSKKEKI